MNQNACSTFFFFEFSFVCNITSQQYFKGKHTNAMYGKHLKTYLSVMKYKNTICLFCLYSQTQFSSKCKYIWRYISVSNMEVFCQHSLFTQLANHEILRIKLNTCLFELIRNKKIKTDSNMREMHQRLKCDDGWCHLWSTHTKKRTAESVKMIGRVLSTFKPMEARPMMICKARALSWLEYCHVLTSP